MSPACSARRQRAHDIVEQRHCCSRRIADTNAPGTTFCNTGQPIRQRISKEVVAWLESCPQFSNDILRTQTFEARYTTRGAAQNADAHALSLSPAIVQIEDDL